MDPRRVALSAALVLLAQVPQMSRAQIERLSSLRQEKELAALDAHVKAGIPAGPMREHLVRANKRAGKDRAAAIIAERVYCDVSNALPAAPFVHYAVTPMSDEQRLEDVYPTDGDALGPVRIVSARGEYEPGAFLVYPLADLGKVSFALAPFRTADGKVFPAERLDLKVVKVWCQNGNGWYSYFGDVGFKLCPELLLHDEDLIRVDPERLANYARITGADGKLREQWINPPRQFDKRFFDWIYGVSAFASMQPGFCDAKSIQPVLLEEGRFRCFFLTANVAPETAAGTYRGAVKLADGDGKALGEIPVSLTVLPFELPQPKAYLQPDRDYLACAYSYCNVGDALNLNGGDYDLARRQFAATLRDFREHNQTMHWLRLDHTSSSLFSFQAMKEAGMRTDPVICFTSFQARRDDPLDVREAAARRFAAFCDDFFGHRNVYMGLDDEPPAKRFESNRALHEPYQKYGLKFIIGNGQKIFEKGAYFMDWAGASRSPEDDKLPTLWNKVGYSYIANGAQQHVGPENPAYNRRQYGMASYLSGWNCTCNYAHHYGPYNDDSSPYKPMVFAYGCGDGVIDTLQWEGFREAMDDIRYATLMTALARKAADSEDLKTRYAGKIALQYLAGFKRDEDDLTACRLEMTRHILSLRALLAQDGGVPDGTGNGDRGTGNRERGTGNEKPDTRNQKPGTAPDKTVADVAADKVDAALEAVRAAFAKRDYALAKKTLQKIGESFVLEDDEDAAVAVYRRCLASNDTPEARKIVNALVVDVYKKFFHFGKARDYCLSVGNRVEAAMICRDNLDERDAASRMFREVLADESATREERFAAWSNLIGDAALSEKYLPMALGQTTAHTNQVVKALENRIWSAKGSSAAYRANYPEVLRCHRLLKGILAATGRTCSFEVVQYVALAYCGVRDFESAAGICREALAQGAVKDAANVYELGLMSELLALDGDEAAFGKAVRAADAKFAGDLPPKTRVSRLDRVGSAAVIGGKEPLARALGDYRKSFFVPYPKREYVVHYSEKPITGAEGWDALSPVPETQKMDRVYSGSAKILLETDIGVGSRGEGVGTEKAKEDAPVPTIQIACDAAGIHFRYEASDEKARDVAAGLVGAGSFESYVAAGENQPYYCLLMDVAPGAHVNVWNTTFSTKGHKRIPSDNQSLCKSETTFTGHSTISYVMLSWNAFSTLIPENGSVWEYGNFHWGRADMAAWNGAESAHGRSQWGRLVFDLPPKARVEILKGVIFDARRIYLDATRAYAMGVIDRWRDPVLGDKDFYGDCLAPLIEKLDAYVPLVKADMSDEDVVKVAEEALASWRDIRQIVDGLRAEYLQRKLGE